MPTPRPERSTMQNVASQARRAAPGLRGGARAGLAPVPRGLPAGMPQRLQSGWIFGGNTNVDGELTSTVVAPGASASVSYAGITTHGSPAGASAGVGGIDVSAAGLFLLYLSVTCTGGGGTGYVRLTVGGNVLSQAAIGSAAIFQGWYPLPNDPGFATFVGEPFVENAAGADITVSGDVYVYPALEA